MANHAEQTTQPQKKHPFEGGTVYGFPIVISVNENFGGGGEKGLSSSNRSSDGVKYPE